MTMIVFRKIILSLCCPFMVASAVMAQGNVSRPQSYNYQSGIEAYQKENLQESFDYFEKELEQNPKNGYAMLWEAYVYHSSERYGEALGMTNKSLKYLPSKDKEYIALAHGMRGDLNIILGDTIQALADYDKAYKAYKDNEYVYKKCNIYDAQGRYDEADAELHRLLDRDKTDAVAWVYLGRNETKKGNYASAIEKCTYAATLSPNYSSAYTFRADAYMAQHKYKEAVDDVIKALSINTDQKAHYQLVELSDKAFPILTVAFKAQQVREPKEPLWSYERGLVCSYKSRYTDAESAFREALRIAQDEGDTEILRSVYGNFSLTLYNIGKYGEAVQMADKALAEDSLYVRARMVKADALCSMGKTMTAIDELTGGLKASPDEVSYYYQRSHMYMYAGLLRNALDDINLAISLEEDDSSLLMSRVQIYQKMKRYEDAVADCKKVIEYETSMPDDLQNKQMLAFAYARSGDIGNALKVIPEVYSKETDAGDEYNLACMYSLVDRKEDALSHFERALNMGYCDFVHIHNDNDLDNIRDIKRFAQLIDEYKAKRQSEQQSAGEEVVGDYDEKVVEVPFTKDSGICKVKCTINGLPLSFYFDTGAADVTISSVEAQFMLKNDYLSSSDVKGSAYYGTADGSITAGTVIVLRKVDFGGLELTNVRASVVDNQKAPLLLGQSVLGRLGKVEIDNLKHVLKITTHTPKELK